MSELESEYLGGQLLRRDLIQLLLIKFSFTEVSQLWPEINETIRAQLRAVVRFGPSEESEWESLLWVSPVDEEVSKLSSDSPRSVLRSGLTKLRSFLKLSESPPKLKHYFNVPNTGLPIERDDVKIYLSPALLDLDWKREMSFEEMAGDPAVIFSGAAGQSLVFQRIAGQLRYYFSFESGTESFDYEEMGTIKSLEAADSLIREILVAEASADHVRTERQIFS